MHQANVLLPTETINRELDFQLFLVAKLARPGRRFFLGRLDALQRLTKDVRGGVFVGRPFDPFFPRTDLGFYRALRQRNIGLVHLDEEGAIYLGEEERWIATLKRRLDPNCLDTSDYVCTWGDFQRSVYCSLRPEFEARVRTTGHPRFDLYGPAYRHYFTDDAAALRSKYGDFVLINTNVSIANHGMGLTTAFSSRYGFDASDPAKRIDHMNYWSHFCRVMVAIVKLANRLSIEFPKLRIVIRPHPSEDNSFYQNIFRDVPNVSVAHQGSVAAWLIACRALVHDGCTTAVEGHLAGTRVITFKPVSDTRYDRFLPNQFGIRCTTEDDVVGAVSRILQESAPDRQHSAVDPRAQQLLSNLTQEAFPRLVAVVNEALEGDSVGPAEYAAERYRARETAANVTEFAKAFVRPLFPTNRKMNFYSRNKFRGFTRAELPRRLAKVSDLTGAGLKAKLLMDTILTIET